MFRKTYFIRQHDSMQCGVACLGMICAYFGRSYSQRILSKYCHATKEGRLILIQIKKGAGQKDWLLFLFSSFTES